MSSVIAVLGEALVDVFPDGEVVGGAPLNVARNLAALGANVLMVTRVGRDARGAAIAREFDAFGLDTSALQRDDDKPTGSVAVSMQGSGHRFDIAEDQAWDRLDAAALVDAVRAAQPAIVYFGTLAQRDPVSRAAIRAGVEATRAMRFLDLNLRDGLDNQRLAAESLELAQTVKLGDDELERVAGWLVPEAVSRGVEACVEALARRCANLGHIVVTCGAAGWLAFETASGGWLRGASPVIAVRDSVGAGDAFASVLLLGDLRGWPRELALRRAAAVASAVCTIRGAVDRAAGLHERALAEWAQDSEAT